VKTMSAPVHIDIRGYGKIYKLAIRDRELPLLAKAIYSYFCAYAGSTTKAYPRRDKIVRDLGINKDTFTKHLNMLVDEGYIAKERTSAGNPYTIVQTVPRYAGAVCGLLRRRHYCVSQAHHRHAGAVHDGENLL